MKIKFHGRMRIIKKIKDQAEVLQLSIFVNIICQLLKKHDKLSICKLVTFTYLMKKNKFLFKNVYSTNNKQDVIYKGLSLLTGDFDQYCDSLIYIFRAIHLLTVQNVIVVENDTVTLSDKTIQIEVVFSENDFLDKVILESKIMTDNQFMKEVIYNV